VPRFGQEIIGGAEKLARELAEEAARRGWKVEVWTTCALNHFTWENELPAGTFEQNGVNIRRFPITSWNRNRHGVLEGKLNTKGKLTKLEQYEWLEVAAHSAPLYAYIAKHSQGFDTLITLPYASPMAHYAAWMVPERTILWPCLHEEPYAYLEPVGLLLETAWGVMFNSPEEGYLATNTLGLTIKRTAILGIGITLPPLSSDSFTKDQPYLVYIGRLEEGKNLRLLYEFVSQYADLGNNLKLIVIGKGPLKPPDHPAIEYLGYISEEEKAAICAGSLALCQPSLKESFSLTIMESWLAGRPVLVAEDCSVTREHVRRSKGGLWFRNYDSFWGAVDWFKANPTLATKMGANGRDYVKQNYTWKKVADRFEDHVTQWLRGDPNRTNHGK
jgi:glycosyltransferase involved in cell wall biosynthesis